MVVGVKNKHKYIHKIYIYIYIYIYIHDELLSVSVYQIHLHSFGRLEAIVEDTWPRCQAVGLNPEPCGWEASFLPHSHAYIDIISVIFRWVNCLDPGINSGPFTYEEDKLLLKYVQENGAGNWAAVAAHLPGRTDQLCSTQYYRLKKWRDQANFVKKQSDESKSYFMPNFDVSKYADLVESGKSLDELIPLARPSKYQNTFNNILQKWQQDNLKRDLVKQELDSRKGDPYVPRPPLLRKYSPNVTKVWDTRNKLRQRIEEFVQSQLVESGEIKSREKTDKAYSLMHSKLDQLKPSTRVSEILRVARGFSQKPDKKGDKNSKLILATVDQEIKDLLYIHWLKENYVNRLQPFEGE
ncbi:uncharacterized protein LOC106868758 [Octopus bimaculoides]|uniref:uncharacterized protein LOC106868758 n=1 Tax=Octopus bimaculoides TaxID=37653 RepID=UPI0022E78092|nr:uncharacterized protein LOC106868758 [Octopus bimaculoides]